MQLLTRRLFMNMVRNTLPTTARSALSPKQTNELAQYFVTRTTTTNQKQTLLRFSVPPLQETINKLLTSAQPHLHAWEMDESVREAEKFVCEEGNKLQAILEKTAQCEENWLATRWLRGAYMQYRDPVTVYSSPGMAFPLQVFKTDEEYFVYAGKVIFTLVKYKQLIDSGKIPIVKMGKFELDNSQFGRIFGTCRIPQPKEDSLEYNPDSKHAIVIHKNHFFKLPLYTSTGQPLHANTLANILKGITKSVKTKDTPIGILSTDTRDHWAAAYKELLLLGNNKANINTIQTALFTVSLDDNVLMPSGEQLNVLSEQLIHGGGIKNNSANRWMDKTIQLVFNPNGMSGFCYEHSPAEGQPIALMTDYVVENLNNVEHLKEAATDDSACAEKLNIQSSPSIDEHIKTASNNVNRLAEDLELNVVHFKDYGKNFPKNQKLSPDSFFQIVLQYAFFKLHKVAAPHYESAHLRIYAGGRTETIRSCSNDSVAFAKAMLKGEEVSTEERIELLRRAVNNHREYTSMALQGRGVDRHLFGLKFIAAENNIPIPKFFSTPAVTKSAHFRLSTSQVASAHVAFMCYGPLTHDGYACCYNLRNNDMILALSAWRSNKDTSLDRFAIALQESLVEIHTLLINCGLRPQGKL